MDFLFGGTENDTLTGGDAGDQVFGLLDGETVSNGLVASRKWLARNAAPRTAAPRSTSAASGWSSAASRWTRCNAPSADHQTDL